MAADDGSEHVGGLLEPGSVADVDAIQGLARTLASVIRLNARLVENPIIILFWSPISPQVLLYNLSACGFSTASVPPADGYLSHEEVHISSIRLYRYNNGQC